MKTQTMERRDHLLGHTVDENENGFINKYDQTKKTSQGEQYTTTVYFVFETDSPWNLIKKCLTLKEAREELGIQR